jgi:hypothetical protein
VQAIVDNVLHGRTYFFAKLLHSKVEKLLHSKMEIIKGAVQKLTDAHYDVQRILFGRFHIDLADIVDEFDRLFVRTPLVQTLEKNGSKHPAFSAYVEIVNYVKQRESGQLPPKEIHYTLNIDGHIQTGGRPPMRI